MKKIAVILMLCCGVVTFANAQSKVKSTVTSVVENVVGSLTSGLDLTVVGTWKYSSPSVQFKTDNLLKQAGGTAVLSTLNEDMEKVYSALGIDQNMTIALESDSTFTQTQVISGKTQTLSGTYSMNKSEKTIKMKYKAFGKISLGSQTANYTNSGGTLTLLFDADGLYKMLSLISSLSSSVVSELSILDTAVNAYDGLMIGYSLKKQSSK